MARTLIIAFVAFLLVVGVGAYAFLGDKEAATGPLNNIQARYGSLVFRVVESDVATLNGMDRFRVTLEPIRGSSTIEADKMLMALCGSILSARIALVERGFDRNRVFRVEIQVRNEGENFFDGPIPLTVTEGACRPDIRRGLYLLRYPDPIKDYVLDHLEPVDGEEGNYEVRFNHLSEASAVLSDFDFKTACRFVAEDRPAILAQHLEFDNIRQLTIVAQSGWDVGILRSYRNVSFTFHWADGACTPVEVGAPT